MDARVIGASKPAIPSVEIRANSSRASSMICASVGEIATPMARIRVTTVRMPSTSTRSRAVLSRGAVRQNSSSSAGNPPGASVDGGGASSSSTS